MYHQRNSEGDEEGGPTIPYHLIVSTRSQSIYHAPRQAAAGGVFAPTNLFTSISTRRDGMTYSTHSAASPLVFL